MALREGNSALHWAATRPEHNTPPTAVAVGHFVQVPMWEAAPTRMAFRPPYAAPRRTVAVTSDGHRGAGVPSGQRPERQRKPRPSRPPLAGGRVGSGMGPWLAG